MEDIKKYLENYNSKPVSNFTKRLWWCAGADEQILLQCPMSDRVKYAGIGGIVLCTGLLAAVSGGYAFYTIFGPKGDAVSDDPLSWVYIILSLMFSFIWGAIILNMDRFIVSSTGKGDGKDTISLKEFGQALPRIIIAIILGFAISAPLEIRILKTEIDAELQKKQDRYLIDLNNNTDSVTNLQMKNKKLDLIKVEKELLEIETHFEKRRMEIQDARKRLEDEIAGRIGSGKAGEGPAAKTQRENLQRQEIELNEQKSIKNKEVINLKKRQDRITTEMDNIDKSRDEKYAKNEIMSHQLDGLLERIHISHEIGGLVPWVIFLILLSIEAGPIFFKMMMTKGAYDFLVENNKKKIEAQHGIVFTEHLIDTINGAKDAEKVTFLELDHEIFVKKKQLEEQNKHAEKIVNKHSEKISKQIDDNPEDFYVEEK
jgi:hypothetical protein